MEVRVLSVASPYLKSMNCQDHHIFLLFYVICHLPAPRGLLGVPYCVYACFQPQVGSTDSPVLPEHVGGLQKLCRQQQLPSESFFSIVDKLPRGGSQKSRRRSGRDRARWAGPQGGAGPGGRGRGRVQVSRSCPAELLSRPGLSAPGFPFPDRAFPWTAVTSGKQSAGSRAWWCPCFGQFLKEYSSLR